jgi:cysteinyl-tRNA synthetase
MVKIAGEKMSKSLGNLIKLKDAIEIYGSDLLRMWILSSHYRKPLLYDEKVIKSFTKPLNRIKEAINTKSINNENVLFSNIEEENFDKALSSDLNTSIALSQIILLAKKINISKKNYDVSSAINTLRKMLEITGLCQKNNVQTKIVDYEIDKLVKERNEFRKVKEFEKADNIRKILAGKGIGIIDNNDGTSSWEKL